MVKIEKKLKNRYHNKHFLKFRYLLICKSDKKLTSEDLKKQIYIYIYIYIPKMNRGKEEIDRLVVGLDKIDIHFTIEEKLSLTTKNTFESVKIRIEHGT
jgi:hypothetical protein